MRSSAHAGSSSAERRRKWRSVGSMHGGCEEEAAGRRRRWQQSESVTLREAVASGNGETGKLSGASAASAPPRAQKCTSCRRPSAPQPCRSRPGSSWRKPSVRQHGETRAKSSPSLPRCHSSRSMDSCTSGSKDCAADCRSAANLLFCSGLQCGRAADGVSLEGASWLPLPCGVRLRGPLASLVRPLSGRSARRGAGSAPNGTYPSSDGEASEGETP
eukprot:scaffold732_cov60-Phaeocystis_antarctica.AAC.17